MFGYITVDKNELKIKDFEKYRSYYCGICRDIGRRCSQTARATLTYDMTFLAVLLSGLYEAEEKTERRVCPVHPLNGQNMRRNRYTAYAADMNVLLVYHNLMDDWLDERKISSYGMAGMLRPSCKKLEEKYPRQVRAIRTYLKALHRAERIRSRDIDLAAGLTGTLMAEIFTPKKDIWKEDLSRLGFFIGKFIYLMDAFEDLEKDRKSGCYNPFLYMADREDFDAAAERILVMMAAEAARAFERLPIVENVDILRNILYSGIWEKYRSLKCGGKCGKKTEGNS